MPEQPTDQPLDDAFGIDAWELMRSQMPAPSEAEQARIDSFIADILTPLGPGDPRRHHFIPRFFLKRFADASEQLAVIRLEDPANPRQQHVTDVAVWKDLYTHVDDNVGETVAVERILAVIDANASQVFRAVDFGGLRFPATNLHRGHLATWIAFLAVRDPYTRRVMEAQANLTLKLDLSLCRNREVATDRLRNYLSREPTQAEVSDLVDAANAVGELDFQPHQNDFIRMMLDSGQAMFPHVFRRKFTVMQFSEPGLVLCDRPLVLYVSPDRRRSDRGVGVANAEELWLPLDRRRVLVLHDHPELDEGVMELAMPFRDSFNQGVIANAVSEIYCHPDDIEVVRGAQLPDRDQPLLGLEGGSWFDFQADGVNAPPRRRRHHRYRRPSA
jgi:hypothetical protein